MGLEAVIQRDPRSDRAIDGAGSVAKKVARGTAKSLELLIDTGVNAVHAANPIRDLTGFASSAYHLIKDDWSWKEYKANAKQGKLLGKGNLANVLFTTGIVASGMYPALLALRAGIGAGAYLGKKIITVDKIKNKISGFCDKYKTKFSWLGKKIFGVNRLLTENYLRKENIDKKLEKIKDDKYYRQQVLPSVLDAAIAAKGYAGLIGLKWISGAIGKTAKKLETISEKNWVRKLSKYAAGAGNFTKNLSSDALSALVFAQGMHHMHKAGNFEKIVNGEYYNNVKNKFNYVADGEVFKDIKKYFDQGKYKDDAVTFVAGTADKIKNYLKQKFQKQEAKQETQEQAVVDDPNNPREKYAVLVAGYDVEGHSNERFLMEQCKVYKDLLDMGFKPKNIKVLIPDGLNPRHSDSHYPEGWGELKKAYADKSYNHDATEKNLEKILKGVSKKVDNNDTFVFYMTTHGNEGYKVTDDYKVKDTSFAAINNGKDYVHDYELAKYTKDINGGKEVYFIDTCHAGGFAKELGRGKDICITACRKDQPAVMHHNGDSLGSYFIEEIKQNGGIETKTKYQKIKSCLKTALGKFKKSWSKWNPFAYIYAQDQTPVVGNQSRATYALERA